METDLMLIEATEREMLAGRVGRGVTLLDGRLPNWWRADLQPVIDLDRLNMGTADYCVLGQLAWRVDGDDDPYLAMRERLGLTPTTALAAGFELDVSHFETAEIGECACEAPYRALTEFWRAVILERRAAPPT
jgi:hypothetical protein